MWGIRLPILIGLILTWLVVFFIIHKGVHRVSKVVMITVPLPWLLLVVLALRGITLDGASAGLEYYLKPDFSALTKASTWLAAYGQVFFSMSLGFGIMIAYASYRPKKSDVTNNVFIITFADAMTSFLAGFVTFCVLGFLAYKSGLPVGSVIKGGPGLTFVTYPAAITKMGDLGWIWPPLVGLLFFVMLLSLGIDSLFSLIEAASSGLHDRFPKLNRSRLAAGICGFCALVGLLFCTRGGLGWLDLFDHWASDYGLVIVGLMQCILIGYFYNTHKIRDFADEVSEVKLGNWWELCIKVITPLVLVYVLASNLASEIASPYGASDWAPWMRTIALGVFVAMFAGAFAITKHWTHLIIAGGALVVGLLIFTIVRPARVEPTATRAGSPQEVAFSADVAGVGGPYVARWDFGDGRSAKDLNVTHTYDAPGVYQATLHVRGNGGRGRAAAADLEVHARAMELGAASIERRRGSLSSATPLAFEYSASPSSGKEPYAYAWDFGDGTTSDDAAGTHLFPKPGDYTVSLKVTDATEQTAARQFPVHVSSFAVVLHGDPRGGEAPAVVEFNAHLFGADGEALEPSDHAFEWDFGDSARSDGGAEATHRFDLTLEELKAIDEETKTLVTRNVALTVRAPDGQTVTEKIEIRLRPPEEHSPGSAAFLAAFGSALVVGGLVFSLRRAASHRRG
jgi:SNF family Na+-dependent transporter/chitodextrinase